MAKLISVTTWAVIWLPENRRQCISCSLPNIPGANTAANKAWQLQRQLDHMVPFHTEDLPLVEAQLLNLTNRDFMEEPDYADACFKLVNVKVWVADEKSASNY